MVDLDTAENYHKFDPSNMIDRIGDLPQQCRQAWKYALDMPLSSDYSDIDKVIILGMGGSAIGGDLLRALAVGDSKITFLVHRDYQLPQWVDERTLVIASSYSGNTEETLSAFSQALQTPAKKLAITTGGRLQTLAKDNGIPVFTFKYDAEPRAAFGYSFFSLLAFSHKLNLIDIREQDISDTIGILEEMSLGLGPEASQKVNTAKKLATTLSGRLVVVYGAGILAKVAYRWKTQFNECSKIWAFSETLSELNHNAVVGYGLPAYISNNSFVVMLRSPLLHPRLLIRYPITGELLTDTGIPYELVETKGDCLLSQMMSMVFLGDYVSYYLALLNEVDPSPVKAIDYLKGRLAEVRI